MPDNFTKTPEHISTKAASVCHTPERFHKTPDNLSTTPERVSITLEHLSITPERFPITLDNVSTTLGNIHNMHEMSNLRSFTPPTINSQSSTL
jgi:hypothetical protein